MNVPIVIIAAVAENGVIGSGDRIPWRLPSDFAFFKRTTMGKPLIMGRRTFEGIGKPLPGRTNIIVSGRVGYAREGLVVASSLTQALKLAEDIARRDGAGEIMIGGGGQIYREALPLAEKLYITHVAAAPEGDTTFPPIDPAIWRVVDEPDVPVSDKDTVPFRVKVYARR